MALPGKLRLKGYRSFKYLHKNSKKVHGKLIELKIAKSHPKILLSHKNSNKVTEEISNIIETSRRIDTAIDKFKKLNTD